MAKIVLGETKDKNITLCNPSVKDYINCVTHTQHVYIKGLTIYEPLWGKTTHKLVNFVEQLAGEKTATVTVNEDIDNIIYNHFNKVDYSVEQVQPAEFLKNMVDSVAENGYKHPDYIYEQFFSNATEQAQNLLSVLSQYLDSRQNSPDFLPDVDILYKNYEFLLTASQTMMKHLETHSLKTFSKQWKYYSIVLPPDVKKQMKTPELSKLDTVLEFRRNNKTTQMKMFHSAVPFTGSMKTVFNMLNKETKPDNIVLEVSVKHKQNITITEVEKYVWSRIKTHDLDIIEHTLTANRIKMVKDSHSLTILLLKISALFNKIRNNI